MTILWLALGALCALPRRQPASKHMSAWVFPTPRGSRYGVRVFGKSDSLIVERLVRL